MSSCKELMERATAFVDGEMSWAEWLAFKAHLALCPPCRDYLDQYGLTVDALQQLPADDVPGEVRERLVDVYREWVAEGRPEADPDEEA